MFAILFFFFQAEDGIRDPLVTGVQTCALPISSRARACARTSRSAPPPAGAVGRGRRMTLYVLRHGIAETTAPGGNDAARHLTPRGRAKMRAAAAGIRALGIP